MSAPVKTESQRPSKNAPDDGAHHANPGNPFVRQFARQTVQRDVAATPRDVETTQVNPAADTQLKNNPAHPTHTREVSGGDSESTWNSTESITLTDSSHSINPPHTSSQSSRHSESSIQPTATQTPAEDQIPALKSIPPIVPVWEIDVLEVPATVAELFFQTDLFNDLGKRMTEASAGGLKSMLVTSDDRGGGRSTVAMGMAIAAASCGLSVALVDADLSSPDLVDQLGLDVPYGWPESIRSGLPIDEVAILAIQDGVTLIPMLPPTNKHKPVNPAEAIAVFEILSDHYDLVIIDGPPATDPALYRMAAAIDSAVLVRDMTRTSNESLAALHIRLKEAGVKGVGVVENFAV